MPSTITPIPTPRTPPLESDPLALAEAALRTVPGIDTTRVRAAFQDGRVLLVGRVQWSSEAAAIGAHLRRDPALRDLRNRIGFHYDDDPHGRAWGHTNERGDTNRPWRINAPHGHEPARGHRHLSSSAARDSHEDSLTSASPQA
ncbi:BON domain-containing protein [Actinokineospora sp. 24-640]